MRNVERQLVAHLIQLQREDKSRLAVERDMIDSTIRLLHELDDTLTQAPPPSTMERIGHRIAELTHMGFTVTVERNEDNEGREFTVALSRGGYILHAGKSCLDDALDEAWERAIS